MTSGPRVVSLLPSATEIVAALGMAHHLVGRSHECDHPEDVRTLPVCTDSLIDSSQDSGAIDALVREKWLAAASLYSIREDELARLAPDVVITQSHCEVCAVSIGDVERAVGLLAKKDVRVVDLHPTDLEAVFVDVQKVADALGVPTRGHAVVGAMRSRMQHTVERTRLLPRPRVLCVEWVKPLMISGNWLPELVEMAGGTPVPHGADLAKADPDLIVLMPCGFDLARTEVEAGLLWENPAWPTLRAVREGRVYVVDGNQYFNRPGPRLVESLQILAEILHPDSTVSQFDGTGWRRLQSRPFHEEP